MKRGGFKRPERPAKPDRSAEFASYKPKSRTVAARMPRMAVCVGLEPPRADEPPQTVASEAESAHMGRVKKLRCVLCRRLGMRQESITDVHHLRIGQGKAQRAPNWIVAALCHERCHQGPRGVHGDRSLLRQAKATEIDLLAWTLEDLAQEARV